MGRHRQTDEKIREMYKMDFKGKKVYRYCIGINCLGEKKFWSYGGARLCEHCKASISGVNDEETQRIHFGK
jgi:hypothetical protein